MASLARRHQPSASKKTLGNTFLSPRRPRDKRKTTAPAHRPGRFVRFEQFQQKLDQILQQHCAGDAALAKAASDKLLIEYDISSIPLCRI
jgi:hypothetical protein